MQYFKARNYSDNGIEFSVSGMHDWCLKSALTKEGDNDDKLHEKIDPATSDFLLYGGLVQGRSR